ncbi:MAG: homocitrate synthase [Chloroflexota bacterium]
MPGTFDYCIVDTTLREGEQFAAAHYSTEQKQVLATALDAFGVEYLELTSPVASPRSFRDAQLLGQLGLRAKLLVHVRCTLADARAALATGVDGVNLFYGTSQLLRQHSHRKSLGEIVDEAAEVIRFVQEGGREVRFSSEDAFRSDPGELRELFLAVDALGVDRIGVADTVGVATPRQVYSLVDSLRRAGIKAGIEFHGHNDSGCAVANSFAALEAGARYLDTTVLGIGERNGITALGSLIARLYTVDRTMVQKYNLGLLVGLDRLVAQIVGIDIPFNTPISGANAFTHKAGVHTNAVLRNPSTYEAINPAEFGVGRSLEIGHSLTGRAAVESRARTLGLVLDAAHVQDLTRKIKQLADQRRLTIDDLDDILMQRR